MSSLLKRLNTTRNADYPIVPLGNLTLDIECLILDAYKFKNKFGRESLLLAIDHEGERCKVFLPSRYSSLISDTDIPLLPGHNIVYKGMKQGRTYEYHDLVFSQSQNSSCV